MATQSEEFLQRKSEISLTKIRVPTLDLMDAQADAWALINNPDDWHKLARDIETQLRQTEDCNDPLRGEIEECREIALGIVQSANEPGKRISFAKAINLKLMDIISERMSESA